ncbi:lipase/acyltransferase domain-containing protein [Conexibacter woesei]|uniref:lipase/acyltransferase domain-containing protein n=1 Tax=Conexibacter woesei TaxID=191495 RepID=UPI00047C2DE7|nr:hypothetical protein [Conexibacter woesei]
MTQARPDVSYDAVVFVPGILGSSLRLTETGEELWGFASAVKYSRIWRSNRLASKLAVTADELAGVTGRVVADGLLQAPAAAPILQGLEPYTDLVEGLRKVMANRAAVVEFPYDWRLSVRYNAAELARTAAAHLETWRRHPAVTGAPTAQSPRLVIVAHSMGGLLARALPTVEGRDGVPAVTERLRSVITLGTPFLGAVKAAVLLNSGHGVRLGHRRRIQRVAATFPGVHDLLPTYRCLRSGEDLLRLTADDIAALGGDRTLAQEAIDFARAIQENELSHHMIYGTHQTTLQSMRLENGAVIASPHHFEWAGDEPALDSRDALIPRKVSGDGTVGGDWATHGHPGVPFPLPQQHGALAKSPEAVISVAAAVQRRPLGKVQGGGEIGLSVPDVVAPNAVWRITLTGASGPSAVTAGVTDAETGREVHDVHFVRAGNELVGSLALRRPGMYRVEVAHGGWSPTSQLVLCVEPGDEE